MGLVHFAARLILALAVAGAPSQGSVLRTVTLVAVILIAAVWGGMNGIAAGRGGEDEDHRTDFTIYWLKAAVVAGLLGGLISWLFTVISGVAVSTNSLFFEVTSGAAFTILLVFIPAVIAVTVGRRLAGRKEKKDANLRPGKIHDNRNDDRERVGSGAPAREDSARRGDSEPDTEVFDRVDDGTKRTNLSKDDRRGTAD